MTSTSDIRALDAPHFGDGRFRNPSGARPGLNGNPIPVLIDVARQARSRRPPGPIPVLSPFATWATPPTTGLRVTWLGHSALLLEMDGLGILLDPMLGERASPLPFGPRRFHPVPATVAQLPPIDVVILSHDHYDHLCATTIRELAALQVPIVTSLGVGMRLQRLGWLPSLITELDWWQEHTFPGTSVSITAAPAQHFSGRGLFDRNTTLWSSWVVRSARHRIFFSGDTGLTDDLAAIGERLGPFDLSMIEIGAADPAWADIHLGPDNAALAFELLGGGTLLPIHWATFDLARHKWAEPADRLLVLAEQSGIRLLTPRIGDPVEPAQVPGVTPWWRTVGGQVPSR